MDSRSLRDAVLAAAFLCSVGQLAAAASVDSGEIDEIVVTAQKRSESLQTVPVSITALPAKELEQRAVESFADYGSSIPNLGFGASGDGGSASRTISIRGVGGDGTTGFYLDETPLPDSLDPRIVDIDRIEVLRGPQGTLYGARSMGGTVRLLTKQPDTNVFSTAVHAGLSSTRHTNSPNWLGDGVVNVPLVSDKLALRAIGFYERDAGFFKRRFPATPGGDDLTTVNNVARSEVMGGSLAMLWKATDALSITPRILYQSNGYNGFPYADATPEHLKPTNLVQSRLFDLQEGGNDRWILYSLGIRYALPFGELISSTSYFERNIFEHEDQSEYLAQTYFTPAGLPPIPSQIVEIKPYHRFVQEIRFVSQLSGDVQFVAGAYFATTGSQSSPGEFPPSIVPGITAITGYPGDLFFSQFYPNSVREPAAFGEVSYQLTDKLKLTAGARWYEIRTTAGGTQAGDATGLVLTDPQETTTDVGVNPKFQAQYQLTPDAMVYVTAARGFRPGGLVASVPLSPTLGCGESLQDIGISPSQTHRYRSDSLWNYEVGSKLSWFENRLTVNSAAFYIDWKNIQQEILLPCGFTFRANAGAAKSEGGELELHARPIQSLDVSSGVGYQHAVITKAGFSGAVSPQKPGDRIYQVPDWTANIALTHTAPLTERFKLISNLTFDYVGNSKSGNNDPFNPRTRDAYNLLDARIALGWGSSEIALVGKNLTDERANLADNRSISVEVESRPRIVTNQPRTIGIEFRSSL